MSGIESAAMTVSFSVGPSLADGSRVVEVIFVHLVVNLHVNLHMNVVCKFTHECCL